MPEEPWAAALGFGCLHFALDRQPEYEFDGREYVRAVRQALEAIPSLDNLEITFPDWFLEHKWEVKEAPPSLQELEGPTPPGQVGRISFRLRVLERAIEELDPRIRPLDIGTEDFKVVVERGYSTPVAMVEPLNPSLDTSPSDCVVLVREFLRHQLQRTGGVRLETVGPTPAHVDVFLSPVQPDPDPDEFWTFRQLASFTSGYRQLAIAFNPSRCSSGSCRSLLRRCRDGVGCPLLQGAGRVSPCREVVRNQRSRERPH